MTGRAGKIDYGLSEKFDKRTVPHGPITQYYKGIYLDINTWDGSDFFLCEGNYGTKITKRAANILKASKLSNIELQNLRDIETPGYGVRSK